MIRATAVATEPRSSRSSPLAWNARRRTPSAPRALRRDVELHLALNGALNDAAIARLGREAHVSVAAADLDDPLPRVPGAVERSARRRRTTREGLPLVPGLIELITKQSSAPGSRQQRSPPTSARSRSARRRWVLGRAGRLRRRRRPRRAGSRSGALRAAAAGSVLTRADRALVRAAGGAAGPVRASQRGIETPRPTSRQDRDARRRGGAARRSRAASGPSGPAAGARSCRA